MKRIIAVVGSLVALAGCAIPTGPTSDPDAVKAAQVRALLEGASQAAVVTGRNLN